MEFSSVCSLPTYHLTDSFISLFHLVRFSVWYVSFWSKSFSLVFLYHNYLILFLIPNIFYFLFSCFICLWHIKRTPLMSIFSSFDRLLLVFWSLIFSLFLISFTDSEITVLCCDWIICLFRIWITKKILLIYIKRENW